MKKVVHSSTFSVIRFDQKKSCWQEQLPLLVNGWGKLLSNICRLKDWVREEIEPPKGLHLQRFCEQWLSVSFLLFPEDVFVLLICK